FLPSIYCLSGENLDSMQLFCLWYVWRNIQGYEMRTAIRDVAEGADMGLETGRRARAFMQFIRRC
ncbi:MAG: hypothetical protein ACLUIE_10335, partial [Parabacteroides merdae]